MHSEVVVHFYIELVHYKFFLCVLNPLYCLFYMHLTLGLNPLYSVSNRPYSKTVFVFQVLWEPDMGQGSEVPECRALWVVVILPLIIQSSNNTIGHSEQRHTLTPDGTLCTPPYAHSPSLYIYLYVTLYLYMCISLTLTLSLSSMHLYDFFFPSLLVYLIHSLCAS